MGSTRIPLGRHFEKFLNHNQFPIHNNWQIGLPIGVQEKEIIIFVGSILCCE